jgi:DNA-binding CsgD family transcriptional regulator
MLPAQSRQLLLAAAAEPLGDVLLLSRAAARLGIGTDALTVAERAGLIDLGAQVGFRHPLVRSAVYRAATPAERRQVHRVLADVTDPGVDPDRRAWHRARAVVGTDEAVAAELERAAGRAASVGGVAAAAAFREAAATLTPDPAERARRSLEAGQAQVTAGAFDEALASLSFAESWSPDEDRRARIELLRAQVADDSARPREALPLLLAAARRLEDLDPRRARDTYLEALSAALFAGRLAAEPATAIRRVAEAARAAAVPERPGTADELLEALVALYTEGYAVAAPLLTRAVRAVTASDLPLGDAVRSLRAAALAAAQLWDDSQWDALTQRQLDVARGAGALSVLPRALATRVVFAVRCGNLSAAAELVAQGRWLAQVSGAAHTPASAAEAWLAAAQGRENTADPLLRDAVDDATARGHGANLDLAYCARAVLLNGLGRYEEALAAARAATGGPPELKPGWALAELVEAGVHAGDTAAATRAFETLSETTRAGGTGWGLGVEAGAAALLSDDEEAEDLHREAIERLGRTRMRLDLSRAQLRYGEWLRRQGRRVDARAQLRPAFDAFTSMGADAFADRARHELVATGETVRRRTEETREALTAQEGHIAHLAADGLTNPEIAAQLYLSPRTVEWHLRKVFTKVGVSTRRQLRRSLDDVRPR